MLEWLLPLAFVGCVLMALRAWRLKQQNSPDIRDLTPYIGWRVAVTVGVGGNVQAGMAVPAILEEVNGDWIRLTWLDDPPAIWRGTSEDGWIHVGRLLNLEPL